jgi:hypothetical protein
MENGWLETWGGSFLEKGKVGSDATQAQSPYYSILLNS